MLLAKRPPRTAGEGRPAARLLMRLPLELLPLRIVLNPLLHCA